MPPPISTGLPQLPDGETARRHEMKHATAESWCLTSVKARGRDAPHREQDANEDDIMQKGWSHACITRWETLGVESASATTSLDGDVAASVSSGTSALQKLCAALIG